MKCINYTSNYSFTITILHSQVDTTGAWFFSLASRFVMLPWLEFFAMNKKNRAISSKGFLD